MAHLSLDVKKATDANANTSPWEAYSAKAFFQMPILMFGFRGPGTRDWLTVMSGPIANLPEWHVVPSANCRYIFIPSVRSPIDIHIRTRHLYCMMAVVRGGLVVEGVGQASNN